MQTELFILKKYCVNAWTVKLSSNTTNNNICRIKGNI